MPSTDEILTDPRSALELADTDVPVSVIVLVEYIDLDPDAERPESKRLAMISSDELNPWTTIGMLEFAKLTENAAIGIFDDEE